MPVVLVSAVPAGPARWADRSSKLSPTVLYRLLHCCFQGDVYDLRSRYRMRSISFRAPSSSATTPFAADYSRFEARASATSSGPAIRGRFTTVPVLQRLKAALICLSLKLRTRRMVTRMTCRRTSGVQGADGRAIPSAPPALGLRPDILDGYGSRQLNVGNVISVSSIRN